MIYHLHYLFNFHQLSKQAIAFLVVLKMYSCTLIIREVEDFEKIYYMQYAPLFFFTLRKLIVKTIKKTYKNKEMFLSSCLFPITLHTKGT